MTLLIACILLSMNDADWGWYVLATIVWILHLAYHGVKES